MLVRKLSLKIEKESEQMDEHTRQRILQDTTTDYDDCKARIRNEVIEEIIEKCSKEYQAISNDTVCKIWLSDLEQLKERHHG